MLGTASEPAVQAEWEAMARQYGAGPDARLVLRYDEGLAHRIYAGADMILVSQQLYVTTLCSGRRGVRAHAMLHGPCGPPAQL